MHRCCRRWVVGRWWVVPGGGHVEGPVEGTVLVEHVLPALRHAVVLRHQLMTITTDQQQQSHTDGCQHSAFSRCHVPPSLPAWAPGPSVPTCLRVLFRSSIMSRLMMAASLIRCPTGSNTCWHHPSSIAMTQQASKPDPSDQVHHTTPINQDQAHRHCLLLLLLLYRHHHHHERLVTSPFSPP